MKIDKVILGSNTNPYYLDFWPMVSKIWSVKFGITPVLALIHDDPSVRVSEEYGEVVYLNPVEGIPISLQAQWIRYWYPSQEPDKTWMISDIDMLPISRQYFIDCLKDVPDDVLVNLHSHKMISFSACYNAAKGWRFKDTLNLPDTFEASLKETKYWEISNDHPVENGAGEIVNCPNWNTDETYSNTIWNERYKKDPHIFRRVERPGGFEARRLDRGGHWGSWDENLVRFEYYLDAHCPRPYAKHKTSIDRLVNLIMGEA